MYKMIIIWTNCILTILIIGLTGISIWLCFIIPYLWILILVLSPLYIYLFHLIIKLWKCVL